MYFYERRKNLRRINDFFKKYDVRKNYTFQNKISPLTKFRLVCEKRSKSRFGF